MHRYMRQPALAVLEAVRTKLPGVPQVICLDTAFHRNMPDVSRLFALPFEHAKLAGLNAMAFMAFRLNPFFRSFVPFPTV